jgi:hypothetical protein
LQIFLQMFCIYFSIPGLGIRIFSLLKKGSKTLDVFTSQKKR